MGDSYGLLKSLKETLEKSNPSALKFEESTINRYEKIKEILEMDNNDIKPKIPTGEGPGRK